MNREGSVLIAAAIFLSWFVFRKSLNNNTTTPSTSSASESPTTTSSPSKSKSEEPASGLETTSSASASSSSSSSAADPEGKYDVFLSFRGTDTRHGFTDYLYNDLVDAGIYTFRDSEKLQIGEEIGDSLLKAIEDSKIWIPIFSEKYAESKWCLRELAHIVKCVESKVKKIYPVFYKVDVDDVKNQQGSYKKAFREHEKNFGEETVQEWRKALNTVGKFKGYELKTETNGHEGVLVKKLVKDVLLERKNNYAHVPDNLVGMDHHIQEMTRLLEVESDGVRIVGVHGMGGIGKTTIAKAVYNKLCHCDSFDGCCFLEDVREKAKQHPNGLVDLQKQLISQILKKDFPDIVDVNDGIKKIKDVVHRKKVLIVLDDVDEKSQFDKVAGECNWFNKASRIIITTRNKEVLDALEATCSGKGLSEAYRSYEPELMTDGDSLKLFSKYAFMRESPPEDYLSLSQKVTSIAARLPLVLVTLGSLFVGIRNKDRWIEKLKKLEKVPNKDVMGKLKVSFDALDDDDKKLFLDIACLFVGKDKVEPYYMWEDCGFVPGDGINTLVLRSLVKIQGDNKLGMHDHLRDLGRQIVREEYLYKLSRVWRPDEALQVLKGGLRLKNVEALCLNFDKPNSFDSCGAPSNSLFRIVRGIKSYLKQDWEYTYPRLAGHDFAKLPKLRYLSVAFADLVGDFKGLHSQLRWLQWQGCSGNSMPTNLATKNLVILDLSNSRIRDDWKWWSEIKVAKKLKVLNLSGCMGLVRGPNFSMFTTLEILNLSYTDLAEINPSLGNLIKLRALDLSYCNLPKLDCSTFKDLESLNLHSCKSLLEVSGLESSVSLTNLKASECASLRTIGDLSNLKRLKELDISYCLSLTDIQGLENLESLENLYMMWCKSVVILPNLSNLGMLKKLFLSNWDKLVEVEGLGGLVNVEHLEISWCGHIERLSGLSNLRMLKRLDLHNCTKLREIEGLSGLVSLTFLNMMWCESIVSLPDMSSLGMLRKLILSDCAKLREVGSLGDLVSLEQLDLRWCKSIHRLPDFSNLKKLKTLDLSHCKKLAEIEGLGGLVSLRRLNLFCCTSLTEIRGLEELKSLEVLDVSKCENIEWLPNFSKFENLKTLNAAGITKIYGIYGLTELKKTTLSRTNINM